MNLCLLGEIWKTMLVLCFDYSWQSLATFFKTDGYRKGVCRQE